jgi:hypothetical protein
MKTKKSDKLRSLDDKALAHAGGGSDYTDACIGGAALGGIYGWYASAGVPIGAAVGAGLGCAYGMFANYIEVVATNPT